MELLFIIYGNGIIVYYLLRLPLNRRMEHLQKDIGEWKTFGFCFIYETGTAI